jgi:agmatinase
VLGLPWDGASSWRRGPAGAPAAIRAAYRSDHSNKWSERGIDAGAPGAWVDQGDLALPQDPAACRLAVETAISELLQGGFAPLLLGGDHSLSYPVVRAFHRHHGPLQILHFDAHPDLYHDLEGDRYSHACPFARVMEEGLAVGLTQVGLRTWNDHQRDQARLFGVPIRTLAGWDGALDLIPGVPIYLSLDIDVLDPAFAPGVSHRESGGLSMRQLIDALARVPGPVLGADLVEFNPETDIDGLTAAAAGKLFKELTGLLLERGP